ncbi:MAG: hypothetical protein ACYTGB_16640 [Planctomycetota bacterium]|jgi:hypothetical protein
MKRLLLLALILPAAGCAGVGARPLAVAGRSGLEGHLESDAVGAEIACVAEDGFLGTCDVRMSLTWLPMRNADSGETVHVYAGDIMLAVRGALDLDWCPWLQMEIGVGQSFVFMDFETGPDMDGWGLCGRAALWAALGEDFRLGVSADVHGWIGSDEEACRAAWAGSIGVELAVSF